MTSAHTGWEGRFYSKQISSWMKSLERMQNKHGKNYMKEETASVPLKLSWPDAPHRKSFHPSPRYGSVHEMNELFRKAFCWTETVDDRHMLCV